MPKTLPIQDDFSAGEVTPRWLARSDLASYKSGVARALNMFPLRHGPIERGQQPCLVPRERPGQRQIVRGMVGAEDAARKTIEMRDDPAQLGE